MRIQKKTNKIEKPLLTSWSIYSEFVPRLSRVTSRPRVCLHLFPSCVLLSTSYSLTSTTGVQSLTEHTRAEVNQRPSSWYSLYMINCFRCVQAIEADPLNLTKLIHLSSLQNLSSSSYYNTSSCKLHYFWVILWYCRRQKQALSQQIFNSSIKSFIPLKRL